MIELREAIRSLQTKGHLKEARRLSEVTEGLQADFIVEEGSAIDDILNSYRSMHRVQSGSKQKIIVAVVRKSNECPFGLPIPQACKFAGDSVIDMPEGEHKINKAIYNSERDHSRCIYASNIMENNGAVECNYGTILQGKKSMKIFHGNPQYPKMWSGFSGIALDRGYHAYSQQYGNELFPFPSIYG